MALQDPKPGEDVSHVMHHSEPGQCTESIELARGQRGGFGWTIKAGSVERIKEIDELMRNTFGNPEEAIPQPKTKEKP
jgi:hypothetical protein